MERAQTLRVANFEDVLSPRHAQYKVQLVAIQNGYLISIQWGGLAGKKRQEIYYREDLIEANEKFDKLVYAKSNNQNKMRTYQPVNQSLDNQQFFLF